MLNVGSDVVSNTDCLADVINESSLLSDTVLKFFSVRSRRLYDNFLTLVHGSVYSLDTRLALDAVEFSNSRPVQIESVLHFQVVL